GAHRHGLARPDFACYHPDGPFGDAPGDPGAGLVVGGVPVQHAGGQVPAERHAGEPVVGLELIDHDCSFRVRLRGVPLMRASCSVSSLVTWLRSMTCRKSSTVVLLACSPLAPVLLPGGGRITVAAVGSGEGVVVNRLRSFPVVLLAEEGDVVDAGGAGGVVAAAGCFRPGPGVGGPG